MARVDVNNITETVGNETVEWMTDPYVDTIAAANIAMQARNIEEHGAGMLAALELVADSQTEQKQQQINVNLNKENLVHEQHTSEALIQERMIKLQREEIAQQTVVTEEVWPPIVGNTTM